MAYKMRFYFEHGTHCLWSEDDVTKAEFGNPIVYAKLPISPEVVDELDALGHEFQTSLERLDRVGTHLWVGEPKQDFSQRAKAAYDRLVNELGEEFTVEWACFEHCWYWLLSDDSQSSFARSRMEVPFFLVNQLNDGEKERVRKEIHDRLAADRFVPLYIVVLVYWKDKEAIPLIKQHLHNFRVRDKAPYCDFSFEIKICKDAIKLLKNF